MINSNFSSLTENGKVIFFLGLSEKVLSVFSQKSDQGLASEVINECWGWIKHKEPIGEILYETLGNEDNGMTIIQEMSGIETDIMAWNCIIDAVAYTSRKAFEREGVRYYPEPIALVDDSLVTHFLDNFERCIENSKSCICKINLLLDKYEKGKIPGELRTEVLKELQV